MLFRIDRKARALVVCTIVGCGVAVYVLWGRYEPRSSGEVVEVVARFASGDNSLEEEIGSIRKHQRDEFRQACRAVIRGASWEAGKAWALRQMKETGGIEEEDAKVVVALVESTNHSSLRLRALEAFEASKLASWSSELRESVARIIRDAVNDSDMLVQESAIRCAEKHGVSYQLTEESRRRIVESGGAKVTVRE